MSVDLVADFVATRVSNERDEFSQDLTHELCMSFEEMGRALDMSPRQAEDATAQAIAQGKIVGRIDQLEGILNCTAGEPKVFNDGHFDQIIERLELWREHLLALRAAAQQ